MGSDLLIRQLGDLTHLVANATEAYSALIFIANPETRTLRLAAAQSLSRDIVPKVEIPYGSGLVGWVAENGVRISVCPFEHDATTLIYYSKDQELKSFIALPITEGENKLIGVLVCDSKKSYAFAKVAEKVLIDCTRQAAHLVTMARHLNTEKSKPEMTPGALEAALEVLREQDREKSLLSAVCDLPEELLRRDALVVLCLSDGGVGEGVFYSKATESRNGNRLFDLVCQHKKVICGDRAVQAIAPDDTKSRSFLSVPFHVLGREAGSINALSLPRTPFQLTEVALLERVAKVVGRELERIRLRNATPLSNPKSGLSSWNTFSVQAKVFLGEARRTNVPLTLARISLANISEIEALYGMDTTLGAMQKFSRLIEQVRGQESLGCIVHGSHYLLLLKADEAPRVLSRLSQVITRQVGPENPMESLALGPQIGKMFMQGIRAALATFPQHGETLEELASKTLRLVSETRQEEQREVAVNAWKW